MISSVKRRLETLIVKIQSSDSTDSDFSVETFSEEKSPEGTGFSRTLVEKILFHDCKDDTDSYRL